MKHNLNKFQTCNIADIAPKVRPGPNAKQGAQDTHLQKQLLKEQTQTLGNMWRLKAAGLNKDDNTEHLAIASASQVLAQ